MKIYFYNKNNLKEIPKSRFGIDLKTLNSMIFENLEGENFTQEELKTKYIQENHYSKYNPEIHILSDKEYINAIVENGTIREKTPAELKIENPELLEDGEYISFGKIIKIERPSNYRIWNNNTNIWDIDETLIKIKKSEILNSLSIIRENKCAIPTAFEDKLIKGRLQDTNDANSMYMKASIIGSAEWFFSSGEVETNVGVDRMKEIYLAIGEYRTSKFKREAEIKHYINNVATNEDIEIFDLDKFW